MGWKIIFAPRSHTRLAEIVRFIARDDPQAAIRFGDYLVDRAESLANFPERTQPNTDWPSQKFLNQECRKREKNSWRKAQRFIRRHDAVAAAVSAVQLWGAHAARVSVSAARRNELLVLQDRHERYPRTIQWRRTKRICARARLELARRECRVGKPVEHCYMKAANAQPEIVTRNGKPVSVILPIKKYQEMMERLEDAEDVAWLKRARRKKLHFRPLEEVLADLPQR